MTGDLHRSLLLILQDEARTPAEVHEALAQLVSLDEVKAQLHRMAEDGLLDAYGVQTLEGETEAIGYTLTPKGWRAVEAGSEAGVG